MVIRKATSSDVSSITRLLFIAMDEILFEFIRQQNANEAQKFLQHFVALPNNQYSWENCFVGEVENKVVCAINIYDGDDLHSLRQPILDYVRKQYNSSFNPEDETQSGEYYIDSFGVDPEQQGRGYGKQMLQNIINILHKEQHKTLGLLVDLENSNAKKLYTKLGFEVVGIKTLAGKTLEHLQIPM